MRPFPPSNPTSKRRARRALCVAAAVALGVAVWSVATTAPRAETDAATEVEVGAALSDRALTRRLVALGPQMVERERRLDAARRALARLRSQVTQARVRLAESRTEISRLSSRALLAARAPTPLLLLSPDAPLDAARSALIAQAIARRLAAAERAAREALAVIDQSLTEAAAVEAAARRDLAALRRDEAELQALLEERRRQRGRAAAPESVAALTVDPEPEPEPAEPEAVDPQSLETADWATAAPDLRAVPAPDAGPAPNADPAVATNPEPNTATASDPAADAVAAAPPAPEAEPEPEPEPRLVAAPVPQNAPAAAPSQNPSRRSEPDGDVAQNPEPEPEPEPAPLALDLVPPPPFAEADGQALHPAAGALLREDASDPTRLVYETAPFARVIAPWSGEVVAVLREDPYGYIVIIEPQTGYRMMLGGLGSVIPEPGDRVERGEPIGAMPGPLSGGGDEFVFEITEESSTLRERLYFRIWEGAAAADPALWLPPAINEVSGL